MTKSRVFFILSLSFIGGIGVASFYYPKIIGYSYLLILTVFPLIFIALFYKNKAILITGFGVLFFVFGMYLTELKLDKLLNLDLNGKNISGKMSPQFI
jgi:hypothetical protein